MITIFAVREDSDPPVYRLRSTPDFSFDPETEFEDEGSFPEGYEVVARDDETGEIKWFEDCWIPIYEGFNPELLSDAAPLWVPPPDETYRPLPATLDYSGERFRFEDGTGLEYTSLSDAVQMSRIWYSGDELVIVSDSGGRWRVRDGLLLR